MRPLSRRARAEELRERLKQDYALRQAAIKAEPLEITYSYYNGTGEAGAGAGPACLPTTLQVCSRRHLGRGPPSPL